MVLGRRFLGGLGWVDRWDRKKKKRNPVTVRCLSFHPFLSVRNRAMQKFARDRVKLTLILNSPISLPLLAIAITEEKGQKKENPNLQSNALPVMFEFGRRFES